MGFVLTESVTAIYRALVPMTIVRQIDKGLVNEEEYRRLCVAYAPFKPDTTMHRIAVHESGHAIALLHFGIIPSFMIVGDASESFVLADTTSLKTDESLQGHIDFLAYKLAGQAAEELEFGVAQGVEDEVLERLLHAVMQVLTSAERQALIQADSPIQLSEAPHVQATLQLYLASLERSREILSFHWGAVQELAALSEERRSLNSDVLDDFWKNHSSYPNTSTS
jgi:hypothetical protein